MGGEHRAARRSPFIFYRVMAQSPFVAIDVGGRTFKLMRTTVLKHPASTLAKVISGSDTSSALEEGGTFYFDRNPDYFTVIADFMRSGKTFLPPNLSKEMFAVEAEFWGVEGLIDNSKATQEVPETSKPESTMVLPQPIGPTLVLEAEFTAPVKTANNGYLASFGPTSAVMKQTSSEGSLASSTSRSGQDPLLGNFIGGLELKTSIEAISLKRKSGDLDPVSAKRAKLQPRNLPSNAEIQAELAKLNALQAQPTALRPTEVVAILSSFELSERNAIIEKVHYLRGRVVDTFDEKPTHLILTEFKNTKKLLVALNKGLEVMSSRWVYESVKAGVWLQPGEYYACTAEEERKHQFSYLETLQKARSSGFLQATQFYISPTVRPAPRDFEEVVTSAGGKALAKRPTAPAERLYVVADLKTKEAQDLQALGFAVMDTEWLCGCVFRQKLV